MDTLINILHLIVRYLHIICGTLIVGGTLFFEMVVPIAIADLKSEHQLAILARARWVFRQIVWSSALALVLSGAFASARQWRSYAHPEGPIIGVTAEGVVQTAALPPWQRSDWWWIAHISTGIVAVLISLLLTLGPTPPLYPLQWMRLNLIILMIVIFLGSVTRHVRLNRTEQQLDLAERTVAAWGGIPPPLLASSMADDDRSSATIPAASTTQPATVP